MPPNISQLPRPCVGFVPAQQIMHVAYNSLATEVEDEAHAWLQPRHQPLDSLEDVGPSRSEISASLMTVVSQDHHPRIDKAEVL